MDLQNQYVPSVYYPNYLINTQLLQTVNPILEWNSLYKQYKEYTAIMNTYYAQVDIYQRRERMSVYQPADLIFFGNKLDDIFSDQSYDFTRVSYHVVDDTSIDVDCAQLFLCTHILAAAWGRFTVINRKHRESSVIHALGIANSGQRKSVVNERLSAPIMAFEDKLKMEHNTQSGSFSKEMIRNIPKLHIKKLLADVDFDNPKSVYKALAKAKDYDTFYSNLQEQIKTPPNISVTDVTQYKLAMIMKDNGEAQLMVSAEGDGLDKLLLHKNTELVLKSYGQEAYIYASAKAKTELRHPALNIAVFCQFGLANKLFSSPILCNRGNISRILPYVNLGNSINVNNYLQGDEDAIYESKITKLLQKFYTRDGGAKRYVVMLDNSASKSINDFRAQLDAWAHGLVTFRPWVAKLHGQAMRLALAIHLWNNGDDPCNSPINQDEMNWGIKIAQNTVNSAYFLHSPYGLTATLDALKIIHSFQRITGHYEQDNFIRNGTDSRRIQQRTGLNRISINYALNLLSWRGWVAIYDDSSGNLQVLPHHNFFKLIAREI